MSPRNPAPPAGTSPRPPPPSTPRLLLSTVYRPFCVDDPFDSPLNDVQHCTVHRHFTREQGAFAIHQQATHTSLHLIAANVEAETDVLEYPSLDEFSGLLRRAVSEGRPYDYVGITCPSSYVRKARRLCELARELSPTSQTVLGGGGTLAVGELVEPFSDHLCRGEGVRFMRELLGSDPEAPIEHPVVPSSHVPNRIMDTPANPPSFNLAVSLGCHRACEFCATSAQFSHRRIPVLKDGAEVFAAMKRVEEELSANGGAVPAIYFVIFDENFLSDEALSRSFLELSREQNAEGTLFLPLLFADAENVERFSVEELLEMGVDVLWIGMETAESQRYVKNNDADFPALVRRLQDNGIKVLISFIAGSDEQTREEMDRDIEFALTLGAVGFQYALCGPMPGTALWRRLKEADRLAIDRPEVVNMSHYYVRHPELDQEYLRAKTSEFHRRDYERHGPMALRYMELRLAGYERHRRSDNPTLRARARGFRDDLVGAAPILSVGPAFSPTPRVRRTFVTARRRLRRAVKARWLLPDVLRGRLSATQVVRFMLTNHPAFEPIVRWALVARALRSDPRCRDEVRTLWGLLRNGRRSLRKVRHGVQPWGQPRMVLTHYGLAQQ